jgi:protein-arginine kinase activator protein McsA
MMRLFVYRCQACGFQLEDENPSPPICARCHTPMQRVFTPPMVQVRGGTPRFHGPGCNDRSRKIENEQGMSEYETEQKELRAGMRKRRDNDVKAFRDYCDGELHHKHGNPDEAATFDPAAKYGDI